MSDAEHFRYPALWYGDDVVPSDVHLGEGWHAAERYEGLRFRWARSGATFALAGCGALDTIYIDVEPGPSIALLPTDLDITIAGETVRSFKLYSRQTISVVCPPGPPGLVEVRLDVHGGGMTLESDSRVLDFRVFRIAVGRRALEVVPVWEGVDVKRGWYFVEADGGESFRWVNTNAQIELTEPRESLTLDIEPAPDALRDGPFVLEADLGAAHGVQRFTLAQRGSVTIEIPSEMVLPSRLVLRSLVTVEPRLALGPIGNFRVFRYRTESERAADAASLAPATHRRVAPASFNPLLA